MKDSRYDMVLVGVGGQGLMLMSGALGKACAEAGIPVFTAENHGLAQRGGSTAVHLRIGTGVRSPLIPFGCADLIASLEPLEALRYVEFLKEGGTVVTNTRIQHPVPETAAVVRGIKQGAKPLEIEPVLDRLGRAAGRLIAVDAIGLARKAGIARAENMVLLGAMAALPGFPVGPDELKALISDLVPAASVEANLAAFEAGKSAV